MRLLTLSLVTLAVVFAVVAYALYLNRNVMVSLKVPGAEVRLEAKDSGPR